tara:strand:- start:129 stop:521 length:393 start_codon:yes stop_codon:yes gene_type:complete
MKYIETDGNRQKEYGGRKAKAGDCVIRSIAIALDQSYRQTLMDLCELGINLGRLPNDDIVFNKYLSSKGWVKRKANRHNYKLMKLKDCAFDSSKVLVRTRGHLTCVLDDTVHDTWDCRSKYAGVYWSKQS